MKNSLRFLFVVFSLTLAGCRTYVPTNSVRTVRMDSPVAKDRVFNAVIEAARDATLPAMTKMDKENGIVEFGSFGSCSVRLLLKSI